MRLSEVLRACSNARVAEAAVASIGGAVWARVCVEAEAGEGDPGELAAQLVREFDDHACPAVRASVEEGMRGSELPVLAGLRHILAHALLRRALARTRAPREPSPQARKRELV
jgi:hypothetical protein